MGVYVVSSLTGNSVEDKLKWEETNRKRPDGSGNSLLEAGAEDHMTWRELKTDLKQKTGDNMNQTNIKQHEAPPQTSRNHTRAQLWRRVLVDPDRFWLGHFKSSSQTKKVWAPQLEEHTAHQKHLKRSNNWWGGKAQTYIDSTTMRHRWKPLGRGLVIKTGGKDRM